MRARLLACSSLLLAAAACTSATEDVGGGVGETDPPAGDSYPACKHAPPQRMEWSVRFPDATVLDRKQNDLDVELPLPMEGVMVDTTPTGFTLDTCAPNTGCAPARYVFDFTIQSGQSPIGPELPIAAGAFVTITGHTEPTESGRGLHLVVRNLDSFGGVSNPIEAGNGLRFVANAGGPTRPVAPEGLWYDHELTCRGGPTPGDPIGSDATLTFRLNGETTKLRAGDQAPLKGADPPMTAWHLAANVGGNQELPAQFLLTRAP